MNNMELTADDKIILLNIRKGFDIMSDLVDLTGWPGERVNHIIEKLDQQRFIERESLISVGFWKFNLTSKGESQLPPLDAREKELSKHEMHSFDIPILKETERRGKTRAVDVVAKLSEQQQLQKLEIAASVIKLIRLGYLEESGFLRRFIKITPKGTDILTKIV
ncbi:MAG: hypothetical protein A4E71_01844 [Smithella sp. PtaU1.Bin162]|nr:MAG: hypothetical protein A4E71_01844 [Smithella sp. PtaU1.Bin162]